MHALVTGLGPPETPFYFRARAVDEAGNANDNRREVTAGTGPDTTPPVFAGCRAVRNISYESFVVEWDAASDNGAAASNVTYETWVRPAGSQNDPRTTFAASARPFEPERRELAPRRRVVPRKRLLVFEAHVPPARGRRRVSHAPGRGGRRSRAARHRARSMDLRLVSGGRAERLSRLRRAVLGSGPPSRLRSARAGAEARAKRAKPSPTRAPAPARRGSTSVRRTRRRTSCRDRADPSLRRRRWRRALRRRFRRPAGRRARRR